MASFLEAAEANDYARAAEVLDLRLVPPEERATRGPELAEMLHHVLERTMWIEPSLLSDDPNGKPEDGIDTERVGSVRVDRSEVPITLSRSPDGDRSWSVSAATVASLPRMYEQHGPAWIESRAPKWTRLKIAGLAVWQWLGVVSATLVAYAIGRFTTFILFRLFTRLSARTRATWDDELVEALRAPSRFLFGVLAMRSVTEPLALSMAASQILSRLLGMVLIAAVAWSAIRVVSVLAAVLEDRAKAAALASLETDEVRESEVSLHADLRVRGVYTQIRVLQRVAHVAIGIVAVALMLTQFEVVRSVGVSLLASAGIAGIVIGFAAQRTFGSLVAGIQLSVTQPIRIGDVVVVEKEMGTIEEVTLTYVVVRVWDERRLVVPMTRFLEHPFENWTKSSAEIHGTVFLHVDWSIPIDALRAEVERVVEAHPDWDRRTKKLHVTDAKERALEVRVLVSASNADKLARLRFDLREQLVRWLQQHDGGRHVPRLHVETSRNLSASGEGR
jgi:small-conductance mechanosensitive channel